MKNCLIEGVPKYISSFDLEQARLGQAIQSLKLELNDLKSKKETRNYEAYLITLDDPELLKQILIKIRDESVNAEWALKKIAEQFIAAPQTNARLVREVTSDLISMLLKKKNN